MSKPSGIRLVLPCPKPKPGSTWGDWYFARSLAVAFQRDGVEVSFDFRSVSKLKPVVDWLTARGSIDLVIRGLRPFKGLRKRPYFIWLISHPDKVSDEELHGAEHVFVASQPFYQTLNARGISCSFLPQCTDRHVFNPQEKDPGRASDVLFVGNRRSIARRPVVDLALQSQLDIQVWGRGWDDMLPEGVWRGQSIDNAHLGHFYSSANIVLNDHTPTMLEAGFASNRVYDVLASGTALLTEQMEGLPQVAVDHCHQYTPATFPQAIEHARAMPINLIREASETVRAEHSFDNRAKTMLEIIQG